MAASTFCRLLLQIRTAFPEDIKPIVAYCYRIGLLADNDSCYNYSLLKHKQGTAVGELLELKVTKSNSLVEAGYQLTLNEQRLILSAISQIDSRRAIHKDYYFQIHAREFSELFGMPMHKSYETLKIAADKLFNRKVIIYGKNNTIAEKIRWCFHVHYHNKQGYVDIGFSPNILGHLTQLSKRFTSYQLKQIRLLNTSYAIRMYEMLHQYLSLGERTIKLDEFKKRLELIEKYSRYSNLKARVITPCVAEINAYTDINISYKEERKNRAVVALVFTIEQQQQQQLPL